MTSEHHISTQTAILNCILTNIYPISNYGDLTCGQKNKKAVTVYLSFKFYNKISTVTSAARYDESPDRQMHQPSEITTVHLHHRNDAYRASQSPSLAIQRVTVSFPGQVEHLFIPESQPIRLHSESSISYRNCFLFSSVCNIPFIAFLRRTHPPPPRHTCRGSAATWASKIV